MEVAKRLGLGNGKPSPTPEMESLEPKPEEEDLPMLDDDQVTEHRSLTCTLLYASQGVIAVERAIRTLTSA